MGEQKKVPIYWSCLKLEQLLSLQNGVDRFGVESAIWTRLDIASPDYIRPTNSSCTWTPTGTKPEN